MTIAHLSEEKFFKCKKFLAAVLQCDIILRSFACVRPTLKTTEIQCDMNFSWKHVFTEIMYKHPERLFNRTVFTQF